MIRMEAACFLVMVLIYLYPSLRCEYDIDSDLGGDGSTEFYFAATGRK